MRLLLATTNPGKLRGSGASSRAVAGAGAPADLKLSLEVDEHGATYEDNATLKARAWANAAEIRARR